MGLIKKKKLIVHGVHVEKAINENSTAKPPPFERRICLVYVTSFVLFTRTSSLKQDIRKYDLCPTFLS